MSEVTGLGSTALKAKLARSAVSAFGINIVGVAMAFLAQLVAARLLGADGYGVYAYVIAWAALMSMLATLGFDVGALRFAATYSDQRDWPRLRGVVRYAESRTVAAGVLIAAAGISVLLMLDDVAPELRSTFVFGLLAVPCFALLQVRSSIIRAYGRITWALLPDRVVREGTTTLCLALAALILPLPLSAVLGGGAFLFGTAVALALATMWVQRARPAALAQATVVDDQRALWLRTALPLLLLVGTRVAMNRMDVVLVGWLIDTTSAGIFNVASRAAQLAILPLLAINSLLSPTIAALHAKGNQTDLQALITTTAWWSLLAALAFTLPLYVGAPYLLAALGERFVEGVPILRTLLLGQFVAAAMASIVPLLTMTGHERFPSTLLTILLLVKIVAATLVILSFGMMGAAVVAALTTVTWNIVLGAYAWRKLRVVPGVLGTFG